MKNNQTACIQSILTQLLSREKLSANALANALHLPTPTIHRLLTGDVQDPRISTLLLIANYFAISIDELIGRKPLNEPEFSHLLAKRPAFSIPLLTLHEASQYKSHIKKTAGWFCWQSQKQSLQHTQAKSIFSAVVKNTLYEPIFSVGAVIVVNPELKPETGDYLLLQFHGDTIAVIRKYISEGKNKYLYHVNNEKRSIKLNTKESKIIGVIIEMYSNFKN
ncbi:MAG: hypothetical protein COY58_09075 [Gammaproteobacteria bacterium CG_4_10_14_0_8_um_filter_38_16]|nr:MAG: hypothetical protein COY58_09075 [Gammaproteobacteria bacterium CG_4_10_14_0_8_um_filter_38_16]PJA03393.1 MAG: hypothetical protein COX72_05510 [Gammaproteobacteria bacterium CG_4_10_14_0_2_um_filter_38_22]PJB11119.1 MAG: hypothetical protein CO120_01220 [Gammaproteobacteria bacterium CG_4_9_14_3_um_filter_38_9]